MSVKTIKVSAPLHICQAITYVFVLETGFCGFGDTCKFLHDRGTYLAGWQLDKLAANPQTNADESDSGSESEEDVPFACFICRKPYTDPVVTRCGHYFCSSCAIKRFAKTPKCAACGAPTGGIFNRADKVVEKMREKKKEKDRDEDADGEDQNDGSGIELPVAGQDDDDSD
jgi:RING finger protein 113A